jgi:hypothetical protein
MGKLIAILMGTALAGGLCLQASAADRTSPTGNGQHFVAPPIKLKDALIANGNGGTLNPGFNTIDSHTLNCKKGPCTVAVTEMVQLQTPDGLWAICPNVDGTYTNPGCPYQGSIAAGGSSYVTGNGQGSITVATGSHTVRTDVYVNQASSLANWQSTYTMYKN